MKVIVTAQFLWEGENTFIAIKEQPTFSHHFFIPTSQHPWQVAPDEIYIIPQQKSTDVKFDTNTLTQDSRDEAGFQAQGLVYHSTYKTVLDNTFKNEL